MRRPRYYLAASRGKLGAWGDARPARPLGDYLGPDPGPSLDVAAAKVERFGSGQLHLRRQLVTLQSGGEGIVAAGAFGIVAVEFVEQITAR